MLKALKPEKKKLVRKAQSARVVRYTDCTSAKGKKHPNECPDMTLNNLMMRFQ